MAKTFEVVEPEIVDERDGNVFFREAYLRDTETGNCYKVEFEMLTKSTVEPQGNNLVVNSKLSSVLC